MNPLLYSSSEMFSSTELIRKSKMIFDKLLSSEVEKAIILRDGKPGFMLLEFDKYEELMKEYLALKEQANGTIIKEESTLELNESIQKEEMPEVKEEIKELETTEIKEEDIQELKKDESSEEQPLHIVDDISEDDLKKALEDIEKMSFDEPKEDKKPDSIEEFNFEDDFIDVVKEKKEQPLKEFWD